MDDILLVFFVIVEGVSIFAGVGLGYYLGRKDKILGVLP